MRPCQVLVIRNSSGVYLANHFGLAVKPWEIIAKWATRIVLGMTGEVIGIADASVAKLTDQEKISVDLQGTEMDNACGVNSILLYVLKCGSDQISQTFLLTIYNDDSSP